MGKLGVAKSGIAFGLGPKERWFESSHPDLEESMNIPWIRRMIFCMVLRDVLIFIGGIVIGFVLGKVF